MYNFVFKRILDIVAAIIVSLILVVPMIIVVIWIKTDSKGPALFKQLRSGKNRKAFVVLKFRTMSVDAPNDSPTSSFKNSHSYITKSGKILRKLSIDELPQLLNVLMGDMSMVGPRPVVLKELNLLDLRDQYGANTVKPGITGWAQVNGRDELGDGLKSSLDGVYAQNVSLLMDLKCIILTVKAVLTVSGHREGHELGQNSVSRSFDHVLTPDEA